MEKFWGDVHSTPTSIMSGWTESSSTESRDLMWTDGVALWLFIFVGTSRGHVCESAAFL